MLNKIISSLIGLIIAYFIGMFFVFLISDGNQTTYFSSNVSYTANIIRGLWLLLGGLLGYDAEN